MIPALGGPSWSRDLSRTEGTQHTWSKGLLGVVPPSPQTAPREDASWGGGELGRGPAGGLSCPNFKWMGVAVIPSGGRGLNTQT